MANYWGFESDSGEAFFISYNSRDYKRVSAIANILHDMGLPIWYDSGLKAGTTAWKVQISKSIDRSIAVLVFVSNGIFERDHS